MSAEKVSNERLSVIVIVSCVSILSFFLAIIWLHQAYLRQSKITFQTFSNIGIGMDIAEVEEILGAGKEVPRELLPGRPEFGKGLQAEIRPVVSGDRFVSWEEGGRRIILGLRDNKVCDKFYFEPSL